VRYTHEHTGLLMDAFIAAEAEADMALVGLGISTVNVPA